MPYSMPDLMRLIVVERAEALHVYPGSAPILEVGGALHRLEGPKLTPIEVNDLFHTLANENNASEFEDEGMVSFHFQFADTAEFLVMAFRQIGHTNLEIRRSNEETTV